MDRNKLFLAVQTAVCILLAALLIIGVLGIFREGKAAQQEDPLTWIFSREMVEERLRPIMPLFFAAVVLTAVGLLMGAGDEGAAGPAEGGKVENLAPGGKKLQRALLLAALVLLVLGVFNGSAGDVFGKAVKICTECVGLG